MNSKGLGKEVVVAKSRYYPGICLDVPRKVRIASVPAKIRIENVGNMCLERGP
jgi:hypothetical protein